MYICFTEVVRVSTPFVIYSSAISVLVGILLKAKVAFAE